MSALLSVMTESALNYWQAGQEECEPGRRLLGPAWKLVELRRDNEPKLSQQSMIFQRIPQASHRAGELVD
jgi:hypothetical protein